ncbi:uncharacterized protein LOC112548729 [Alligator sinensis]|uniref:Uncharacterized protein LOC112548729 n=1 Tax=Alligator sinensis TaxID=38654 RepID=A0A3Q0FTZ8_ALLSI|nr:uncharacterized protein LOC112548729 [Alligator sinensis]
MPPWAQAGRQQNNSPPIKGTAFLPPLGAGQETRDPAPGPGAVPGGSGGVGETLPAVPGSSARGQMWPDPSAAVGKPCGGQRCQQLELKALWAWLAQAEQDIEVILSCAQKREERLRAQVEVLRSQNLFLVLALKAQKEQDQDQDDSPTETSMDMEGMAEECWPPWRGSISPRQEMEAESPEDKGTQTNLPQFVEASTQAEGPGHKHASTQTRALCLSETGCQTEPLPVMDASTQTNVHHRQKRPGHGESDDSSSSWSRL